MRLLIAALFAGALITLVPVSQETPVNNLEGKVAHIARSSLKLTPRVKGAEVTIAQVDAPKTPAPDPQPETMPAAMPVSSTQVQGCNAYTSLLNQYDWNVSIMAAVMKAESNCNPNAASPPNWDGLRDYGLMQLHGQEIYDPATNVAHAYSIWQNQGYHAWSTYTSGAYLKYL